MTTRPRSRTVTVTAIATPLADKVSARRLLILRNADTVNAVRLGSREERALQLLAGGTLALDDYDGELWATAVAGTPAIEVLEVFPE